MNVTEAHAVNVLLRYLLDPHADSLDDLMRARDAAAQLADRANARLVAGRTGADVLASWDGLLQGCPGCRQCVPPIEPDGEYIRRTEPAEAVPAHGRPADGATS